MTALVRERKVSFVQRQSLVVPLREAVGCRGVGRKFGRDGVSQKAQQGSKKGEQREIPGLIIIITLSSFASYRLREDREALGSVAGDGRASQAYCRVCKQKGRRKSKCKCTVYTSGLPQSMPSL